MLLNVLGSLTLIDQSIDWTQIYDDKLHQYRRVVAELVGNLATESWHQSPANHFEREKSLNRISPNMSKYWLMVYSQKLENGDYINAIKLVRCLTGWGLKESKDAVDAISAGYSFVFKGTPEQHADMERALVDFPGVIVC